MMTMKAIVLAAAVTITAQPVVAYAGSSCGGGGGGGGDSGSSSSDSDSSSSSSSDSSSSSSTDSAPACEDSTDVVGYRQCTSYGHGWAMKSRVPRFFLELGTSVRQFGADPGGSTGSVSHGSERFSYRMVAPSGESATAGAVATTLRLGIGLSNKLYAGIEGEIGGLTSSPARVEMMSSGVFGTPEVQTQTAMLFGAAGFVGARFGLGRASLALEGAGGVRDVRYRYTSYYHHCEDTATIDVVQGVLEARARGELWLNPWITVGAQAGANIAAKGDWMTGLYFGFHSRAFGGR